MTAHTGPGQSSSHSHAPQLLTPRLAAASLQSSFVHPLDAEGSKSHFQSDLDDSAPARTPSTSGSSPAPLPVLVREHSGAGSRAARAERAERERAGIPSAPTPSDIHAQQYGFHPAAINPLAALGTGAEDDSALSVGDYRGSSRSPSPALTVSNGAMTPPSVSDSLAPSTGTMASPNLLTVSPGSAPSSNLSLPSGVAAMSVHASASPKAETGFGTPAGEDEIKRALSNKDRLFVLMLGKEFEAFIARVSRGEITTRAPLPASTAAAGSLLDSLGPSKKIDCTATSKYQRMITYKLAEWYGLRAAAGLEGSMVIGVLGALEDKSLQLKVSSLVPEAAAPQTQQFRIMQREAPSVTDEDGMSRATSASGEDAGTESSSGQGPRGKSLKERTLAYQIARKRIIGDDDLGDEDNLPAPVSAGVTNTRPRQQRFGEDSYDELDPVPRRPYVDFEYVYPSLYNSPPEPTLPNTYNAPSPSSISQFSGYSGSIQGGTTGPYQPYMSDPIGYQPGDPRYQLGQLGQHQVAQPTPYTNQAPMAGYGPGWQQSPMGPTGAMMGGAAPHLAGSQMGMMMPSQGWYPPDMPMPTQPSVSMPMIPQGMPYAPPNFQPQLVPQQRQQMQMPQQHQQHQHQHQQHQQHHPQHNPYQPTFVQPTPLRPDRNAMSSNASSISSRSYQDVHSRPHSRGSTTSTRSAASSVRLGVMYPTTQQPGYGFRQKAIKGQTSLTGMRALNSAQGEAKRNGRQSPASTTSSRSSRRTSSIHIIQPQPGQHPLPQRPDWAANNVPYHPTPLPGSKPNTSDFPPLRRGAATNAEPMQIEKVKMRPPSGSVWISGGGARQASFSQGSSGSESPQGVMESPVQSPLTPHAQVSRVMPLLSNPQRQVASLTSQMYAVAAAAAAAAETEADPDFPRRMPSRTTALYDPSAAVPRQVSQPRVAVVPPAFQSQSQSQPQPQPQPLHSQQSQQPVPGALDTLGPSAGATVAAAIVSVAAQRALPPSLSVSAPPSGPPTPDLPTEGEGSQEEVDAVSAVPVASAVSAAPPADLLEAQARMAALTIGKAKTTAPSYANIVRRD